MGAASLPTDAFVGPLFPVDVGVAAFRQGLELHELSPAGTSLEALFLQLTSPAAREVA